MGDGWLTHGNHSETLEDHFVNIPSKMKVATVSNCTAGLHLSCLAAGFSEGDEVIVPARAVATTQLNLQVQNLFLVMSIQ